MDASSLDYLFHPRSIAVIGVSPDLTRHSAARNYVRSQIEQGFKGNIYPVNPNGGEVCGLKIYQSVTDVPNQIDFVISAIPARHTLQLVKDCAARGVRAIHFFTSGFSEIEDEESKQLESDMLRLARQNGIRILGPNCMGLYCSESGLSFSVEFPGQISFPKQSGPFGFFSQSGGNSIYCVHEAVNHGVYFSKVASYGNAADLNESDFLEYFTHDPETRVIGAYIEGVKDGQRFFRTLKRASRLKPVIIFKAGNTESGTKVAASHTGSIAGDSRIWNSLLKQAGAVRVQSIEEIVDVVQLFSRMSLPESRNTAVIGSGGGPSVKAADDCSEAGLTLPVLPAPLRQRLKDIYCTEAGRILRNPVDTLMRSETLPPTIKMIADWDGIDLLIIHIAFDAWSMIDRKDSVKSAIDAILNLKGTIKKPVTVVLHCQATDGARQLASEVQGRLQAAGFTVYPSIKRAASAINKFIEYHEWRRNNRED